MDETTLQTLNQNIDQLISICDKLKKENYTLRQSYALKQQQYQQLLEKNNLAQAKLESLLIKLKTEQG